MSKMKILRSFAVASAAFFIACNPVSAQWQTPDHSVPIGRGSGTGFKFAAPGVAGQTLVSNGASSDPTFQAIAGPAFGTQSANTVFSGPTSGGAANPTFRALVGADLPNPSASTLGGVQSLICSANQWLNTISVSGVPACAQPAFSNISGTAAATQGGTGLSTFAIGDLLYAATTSTLARLADIATGNVLRSGGVGVAPAWGKVALGTDISGTLPATNFPALTGDVTTSAGALATTLATVNANVGSFGSASAVPSVTVNAKGLITAASSQAYQNATAAQKGIVQVDGTTITASGGVITAVGAAATSIGVGTTTIAGGTSGHALYNNAGVLGSRSALPTIQRFLSGSGTYTTPAGCLWIEVLLVGGGGGGGGGNNGTPATSGGNTTWNATDYVAGGGAGGGTSSVVTGGAVSGTLTANVLIAGGSGGSVGLYSTSGVASAAGGSGGPSSLGGAGPASVFAGAGNAAATNTGSGGGGGGTNNAALMNGGYGGGSGATLRFIINSPGATYGYAVGSGGAGAAAGTNGLAGGNGAAGQIVVIEHYN
ncbi:hypothetical protein [Tardiphaga sp. 709]|uniref:hypothetical protein n=1 Tax=Tardiphaga sp. 709 TaxID=3076039 RepID=UPI0028E99C5D|nr:hypothetical protein [Tardiphaga sp. 709]WNV09947.1 hypothetical protein RSO67_01760 [Tardiphaga sp. 709]